MLTGTFPNPGLGTGVVLGSNIADNTILGGNIVNGTVGTNDIGDGAVARLDIPDHTVTSTDVDTAFAHAYQATGNPLSVTLPAGTYVFVGQVTFINQDGDLQSAACSLNGKQVVTETLGADPGISGDTQNQDTVPIYTTDVFSGPTTVPLSCSGFGLLFAGAGFTAIRVNGLGSIPG
ncbi:MAG: hypothetical protein QOF76_4208 [Solirubrobacteraceae bacterium]|nr:hypothetical protein [Solirubrobacteraceae bacterium]